MRAARVDDWLKRAAEEERARIVAQMEKVHAWDDPSPLGKKYEQGWHDAFAFCLHIARMGGRANE